jgi:hypothetical protein
LKCEGENAVRIYMQAARKVVHQTHGRGQKWLYPYTMPIYPDCILTLFISTLKMEAACSSRMLVSTM